MVTKFWFRSNTKKMNHDIGIYTNIYLHLSIWYIFYQYYLSGIYYTNQSGIKTDQ